MISTWLYRVVADEAGCVKNLYLRAGSPFSVQVVGLMDRYVIYMSICTDILRGNTFFECGLIIIRLRFKR